MSFLWDRLKFNKQYAGFPIYQVGVVFIMILAEMIAHTSVFPYSFFMLKSFNIANNDSEIPKYSGYIAFAFSLSQVFCNIFWSKVSDRVGRKPVLLTGLFGAAVSMLLWGFSTNFYLALASKVLGGLLNGNVAVARTILGEISPNKRHHSLTFSIIPLSFNIGSVIGPLIGNHDSFNDRKGRNYYDNAEPTVTNWNSVLITKRGLAEGYPYALPNIVVALILFFAAVVVTLFLEETHDTRKTERDRGIELGDSLRRKFGFEVEKRSWQLETTYNSMFRDEEEEEGEETNNLIDEQTGEIRPNSIGLHSLGSSDSLDLSGDENHGQNLEESFEGNFSRQFTDDIPSRLKSPFTVDVINSIISHFLMTSHVLVYAEFLPVFLASRIQAETLQFPLKIKGGFGMNINEIGKILSMTGLFGIIVVLFILPAMNKRFSSLIIYRIALVSFSLCYFFIPEYIFILPDYNPKMPKVAVEVLLYINAIIKEFASVLAFSQIIAIIHRSAAPEHRAIVNGYAVSVSGLANLASPLLWGYLMTTFENWGYTTFFWWLLSLMASVGVLHSFLLKNN
ncbi:hypothetical protein PACTADRAFT_16402 [Pachysolen tannophilus NRRL Y-2460]|uniref:Major facilitator superfamily (MFS) profile domain-containing protein n=1 Tax=Pachysolen tannophilus NRRL Y-2460 TaxID=669874 RepID=A0A1E4TX01_PACTA|nr:hypothetical protein PACTADRAFT_16402 [Pachysolen tannophilus NRRL Y-2460]